MRDQVANIALIRHVLKTKGLTQKALGELLGVTPAAISQWLRGKEQPGESNLRSLTELGGFPVEFRFDDARGSVDIAYATALSFKTNENLQAWNSYVRALESEFWSEAEWAYVISNESWCEGRLESFWEGFANVFMEATGKSLPENPRLLSEEENDLLRAFCRHLFGVLAWFDQTFGLEDDEDGWAGTFSELSDRAMRGMFHWRFNLAFKLSFKALPHKQIESLYPYKETGVFHDLVCNLFAERDSDQIFDDLCDQYRKLGWDIRTDYFAISRVDTEQLIAALKVARKEEDRLAELEAPFIVPPVELPIDPSCSIYTKFDDCSRVFLVKQISSLTQEVDRLSKLLDGLVDTEAKAA